MIGTNRHSWNWLDNAVVPAGIVVVEASWIWPWITALGRLGAHRADIPYSSVLLLALLASTTAGLTRLLPGARFVSNALRLVAVFVGAGCSAGVLAVLFFHAPFEATAVAPWTIVGRLPSSGAAIAWFLAALCWARGSWIGWREVRFVHVFGSICLGGLGFACFFIYEVTGHRTSFTSEAIPAELLLLLVAFPVALAVAGVVHERQLEHESLRPTRTVQSPGLFVALVAPMALISAGAVVIAFIVGPLAPWCIRALELVGRLVPLLVDAIATVLGHLLHVARRPSHELVPPSSGGLPRGLSPAGPMPVWVWIAASVIGAMVLALGLYWIARLVAALLRRRRPRSRGRAQATDEERATVFTWRHLLDQLMGLWWRLLGRRVEAASSPAGLNLTTPSPSFASGSIRESYRLVLVSARSRGRGRAAVETPIELAVRLSDAGSNALSAPLGELTALYHEVRYGGAALPDSVIATARADAERVIGELAEELSGEAGS